MLGAGVISGLLGIGSGALKVPAMDMAVTLDLLRLRLEREQLEPGQH